MNKKKQLAVFIAAQIDASEKSQTQIAGDAGFENPNMMSMIRKGTAQVPIQRALKLADALEVPRVEFMARVLEAYAPALLEMIKEIVEDAPVSPDEIMLLRGYRILRERGVVGPEGVELRPVGKKRK